MANISQLVCDAWLLPTDTRLHISTKWSKWKNVWQSIDDDVKSEFRAGNLLTAQVSVEDDRSSVPILAPVDGRLEGKAHLLAVLEKFVSHGARVSKTRPLNASMARSRPLLAVPLFGTGNGGFSNEKGEVIRDFLAALQLHAERNNVDIALVFYKDPKGYALAQSLRRERPDWGSLSSSLQEKARDLAELALRGQLVPFMGAGLSIPAGIPGWEEMLGSLADSARMTPLQKEHLLDSKLDLLDKASYIATFFGEDEDSVRNFKRAIASKLSAQRTSIATSLLASLRSEQAITTNYDLLYELSYESTGQSLSVIPGRKKALSTNWLLKLHGTVDMPSTIVMTREDYLGYSADRNALSSIVKANLITRHILFVGFGLLDPHFHQIMHDVKRALPGEQLFASAITLEDEPHLAELWKSALEVVPLTNEKKIQGSRLLDASRRLEIFLDMLAAYSTDGHEYLLDNSYRSGLSESEESLRLSLDSFVKGVPEIAKRAPSWVRVERMLGDLGQN